MEKRSRTPDKVKKSKKGRLSAARIALLAIAAIVIGLGTIVFSQSQNKNPRSKSLKEAPSTTGGKTYVAKKEIIFDQATGTLRKPNAEETKAMIDRISSMTNRSTEGLAVKELPNGTKQVTLAGRLGGVVLGRAREDGTTEIRCVTTLEEATAFLGLEEASGPQSE